MYEMMCIAQGMMLKYYKQYYFTTFCSDFEVNKIFITLVCNLILYPPLKEYNLRIGGKISLHF